MEKLWFGLKMIKSVRELGKIENRAIAKKGVGESHTAIPLPLFYTSRVALKSFLLKGWTEPL